MEDRRAAATTRLNMLKQLIDSKAELLDHLKENPLHSMRERMAEEINANIRGLQVVQGKRKWCLSVTPHNWSRTSLCWDS